MKKTTLTLTLLGALALQPLTTFAEDKPAAPAPSATPNPDPYTNETKAERDARMAWWRDARFGLFIHWGVYAVPGGIHKGKPVDGYGEWIMEKGKIPVEEYKAYAAQFNHTQYDPEAWVALAKKAGMKYIVITAKHHDGFALWPSAVNDWNIGSTPYKKDLLKPLAEACKKHGIKLGFYYSQAMDWSNGGACSQDPNNKRTMDEYIDQVAVPQVNELLTNYGDAPVILWWDTPAAMNEERAAKLIEPLKLKPGIIHNNRLLKVAPCGVVDMEALKSGKREPYAGDTETPEQHIPATGIGDHDWEACMTINHTWGFKSDDHEWKSTKVLLQNLIDIASKGGNYLLNVGPTAEGLIPQASVERLEEIGKWMDANGESIYGTGASPFPKLPWGRCTTKKHAGGTTLYLHVFEWPTEGKLLLPGLENKVKSAQMLVGGAALKFEKTPNGVVIDVPAQAPDANASVIKMEIAGKPKVVQLFIKPAADGSIVLPASLVDFGIPAKGSAPSLQLSKDGPEISSWHNPEAPVSWSFSGLQPGDYEVLAEISGPDNAKAVVELGAAAPILNVDVSGIKKDKTAEENKVEKLPASLKATGSYHKFETQNLGTLEIEEQGEKTLTIRPDPTDWKPFNLRKVTLKPVAEKE
jgi:alpha-L-fucosidase